MKCRICGKEKVTLIVPPDKHVCYCLGCVHRDLSKDWKLPKEAEHVISIVSWLEKQGHILPEANLVLGKPIRVVSDVPKPRKRLKK